MIKVLVTGASGKMGREVCRAVLDDDGLELVGAVDVSDVGTDIGELTGSGPRNIIIRNDLPEALAASGADVMVDFTNSSVASSNIRTALEKKVHAVVGTTGISAEETDKIASLAREAGVNIIIAPNFALGAVLMMRFAAMAAKYLPDVEIIEMHHDQKKDAPSGTSIKTAEMISETRRERPQRHRPEKEVIKGVRGGEVDEIHIHSVRLSGLVAHQMVVFGGQGQTLTIRHDSVDRTSFMPGIMLAIREVSKRKGLTYGLEKLLDI